MCLPRLWYRLTFRHVPHHATVHAALHHAGAVLHHRLVHSSHAIFDEISHFGGVLLERVRSCAIRGSAHSVTVLMPLGRFVTVRVMRS